MERFLLRLWLHDTPGALGAVATRIGAAGGNVTALEVLERDGGVAVDELVLELPEGVLTEVSTALGRLAGVGIEEVRPLRPEAEERGLRVMRAAVAVLEAPSPAAALDTLMAAARDLFDLSWVVLADPRRPVYAARLGEPPAPEWFAAFASAAGALADGVDTTGSGVLGVALPSTGLTLGAGRALAFRQRERRELELLARVADRLSAGLTGAGATPAAGR